MPIRSGVVGGGGFVCDSSVLTVLVERASELRAPVCPACYGYPKDSGYPVKVISNSFGVLGA